jgi:hypothetical protein
MWNTEVSYDAVEEEMSCRESRQLAICHPAGCEADELGETIHTGEDGVAALGER